ncbi:hypothetical protein NCS52_00722100 [Fusarium sp. LHS14.1]|nr:hypothetical protein NCS52_00722100 [Fusarium sp. LHS14.1]
MASQATPVSGSSEVKGLACVALQDWDPRAPGVQVPSGLNPTVAVRSGDYVWVYRVNNLGFGYTHVVCRGTHKRGWVPLSVLKRGVQRVDPLPIEFPSTARPINIMQSQSTSSNVLQETLRRFWSAIQNQQSAIEGSIPGLTAKAKSLLFHRSAAAYGDVVYRCILPQARDIMATGSFHPNDLRALPSVSSSYPKEPGVYIILYGDFGERRAGPRVYTVAIYVGQTVAFQKRKTSHRMRAENEDTSQHYRLAARAGETKMIPILLQGQNAVPSGFLDIAEFSFVCLFRSWFSGLFTPVDSNALGAYVTEFQACSTFSQLIDQVAANTRWAPTGIYGLNWNTPILRNVGGNRQWTCWYHEADDMFIYRTRWLARRNGKIAFFRLRGEDHIHIPDHIQEVANFQHEQPIHVVIEVRKREGEYLVHPIRYCRLPPYIGRNPELEKLRSLAIKVEWLDGGVWKHSYLNRTGIWAPSESDALLHYYRRCLFLFCDVEQITYTNAPGWLPPRSPTQVNFLRYDHLNQKHVVEVVAPRTIPWPHDRTMQQNTQRLHQMFPGPDTVIGRRPPRGFFIKARAKCDMCFSEFKDVVCKFDENDNSCEHCRPLNRPCTWSRANVEEFGQEQALEELGIAFNARAAGNVHVMPVPPFDPSIEEEEHAELEG